VVLPLPEAGAPRFGLLMRGLREAAGRRDLRHAAVDCMIAVTAIEHGAVLVSGDALFPRLAALAPELRVANWTTG
jgi:predicted nucleic acid-binding protein